MNNGMQGHANGDAAWHREQRYADTYAKQVQEREEGLQKRIAELEALLDEAVSYTSCPSWSPSLTDEIKAALAKVRKE